MDLISAEQREAWKPQAVELKAGSCTFHHGLCFHYAAPNTTEFRRRALVAIFIPDGITYAADEKMSSPFDNTITAKKGEALRGTDFAQLL
jgi:ectoine hydroxylase-related dioxygenase (phytanoyl-CoA dioxygenase family)